MDRSVNLTTSFNQTNGSTRRKTMFDKFSVNGLKAINVSIHPFRLHLCAYERPVLYKRFCTVICVAINAPTKKIHSLVSPLHRRSHCEKWLNL